MSRPPTEHRTRSAGRFRTPAANRLARAVCIALLAADMGLPLCAQAPQPPGAVAGTSADASDPPLFVGPPDPPWLCNPPDPGVHELAEGLYVATGTGGNVVARVTPEGVVIAGGLTPAAEEIAAELESVTDQPVRYVLRTHRRDGRPAALPLPWRDAKRVALDQWAPLPAGSGSRNPSEAPDLSFTRGLSLFLGDAEVQLHHFAPAHTGGDTAVLFPDLDVLYAGDLVVCGMPFVDYAAGGNSRGWVETLNGIIALDFETAVPGTGTALTKRDVQAFRDRLVTLRMRMMQLLYRGVAREDAALLLETSDLDRPLVAGRSSAERSFAALYDELAVEREEARAAAVIERSAAGDEEETERP